MLALRSYMRLETGFSLLEVLISISLISILLLGMDALEIHALKTTRAAYYFDIAALQLIQFSERVESTDGRDLMRQLENWNEQNKKILPNGHGEIEGSFPNYKITIFWGDENNCDKNKIGTSGCVTIHYTRQIA